MSTIGSVKVDGDKLHGLRVGKFSSRGELAQTAGLHRDHVGRLERDEGGNLRLPVVRKPTEAPGVGPMELANYGGN